MKISTKPLKETADVSRGEHSRRAYLVNTLLVAGFFLLLYLLLGLVAAGLSSHIPDRWEARLGKTVVEEMRVEDEKADLSRAEEVLRRLMENESLRALDYHLFLIDLDMANAVAVPGGGIGLTSEFLEVVESEEGLAFVLAHELGHHQHRHILRGVSRAAVFGIALALLGGGDASDALGGAVSFAEMGYSRDQEREADTFAVRCVRKVYGNSNDMLEFFRYIRQVEDEPVWQKYFGSHPLTQERIEDLEQILAEPTG